MPTAAYWNCGSTDGNFGKSAVPVGTVSEDVYFRKVLYLSYTPPEHMFSLWTNYQATPDLSFALGGTYQDSYFATEDNTVQVPDYTRIDAAAYYQLSDRTMLQLNIENLFDEDYFPDAHSNTNISMGRPLNARLSVVMDF